MRQRGENIPRGLALIAEGARLDWRHVAVLAGQGVPSIAAPDATQEVFLFVTASPSTVAGAQKDVAFRIAETVSGETATANEHFFAPDHPDSTGHHEQPLRNPRPDP